MPGAGAVVKKDGALFGPKADATGHNKNSTSGYLRRSVEEAQKESSFKYAESRHKDPIPSRSDHPVMGIRTSKNFITANAVEAILAAPRVVPEANPNYMLKQDYGKVPAYLSQVKEEIRRENEMIDRCVSARVSVGMRDFLCLYRGCSTSSCQRGILDYEENPLKKLYYRNTTLTPFLCRVLLTACRYVKDRMGVQEKDPEHTEEMDEYERMELISQLKAKWDVTNANYQRMTHVINLDSVGKMRRKEELETALKQLESDIEKLQRAGPIIIRNS